MSLSRDGAETSSGLVEMIGVEIDTIWSFPGLFLRLSAGLELIVWTCLSTFHIDETTSLKSLVAPILSESLFPLESMTRGEFRST